MCFQDSLSAKLLQIEVRRDHFRVRSGNLDQDLIRRDVLGVILQPNGLTIQSGGSGLGSRRVDGNIVDGSRSQHFLALLDGELEAVPEILRAKSSFLRRRRGWGLRVSFGFRKCSG